MSGKNSKLRYLLDKEKGRNIRLEKQKKSEKEAAKRRQAKGRTSSESKTLESKPYKPDDQINVDDDDEDEEQADIPLSDLSSISSTDDLTPHQRLTVNNTSALTSALTSISLPLSTLPLSTHQSITSTIPTLIIDTNDDIDRESALYSQSLTAVRQARTLLLAEGAPFSRPADYFAEMVKSDEHMGKVKGRLVSDAAAKKASADAKRQRQLKKYGKAVQQEQLKERAREKRETMDKVAALKRKRRDNGGVGETQGEEEMFDVAVEDAVEEQRGRKKVRREGGSKGKGISRAQRDEKFGFGGKKRHGKSNDAFSTGDVGGFAAKRTKGGAGGKAKVVNRPGKARRAKMRRE